MANIPTLSIPQVQRGTYAGAQADLSSRMAPAQGQIVGLQGVKDVAAVLGEFGTRIARAREEATLSENSRKLNESFAAFQQEIATEPDPTRWTGMWQKHVDEAQKSIAKDAQRLGTDGRRRLSEQVANWASETTTRVGTQAKLGEVKELKQKFTQTAISFAQDGQLDKAQAKITEAWQLGLMSDADTENAMTVVEQTAQKAQVETAIGEDPDAAFERLDKGEWSAITPDARNHYKLEARQRAQDIRSDWFRGVDDQLLAIQQGDTTINPSNVENTINEGPGTAAQKRLLLNRLAGLSNPVQSSAAIAQLWDAVDAINPDDPQFRLKVSQIREALSHFDASLRTDVVKALEDKVRPDYKEKGPTEALEMLRALRNNGSLGTYNFTDRPTQIETENVRTSPWYWNTVLGYALGKIEYAEKPVLDDKGRPIEKRDPLGRPIVDEARFKAQLDASMETQAFYGELKRQLEDYAKSNPQATPEDHKNFLKQKIRSKADVMGATSINNWLTGQSDADNSDSTN